MVQLKHHGEFLTISAAAGQTYTLSEKNVLETQYKKEAQKNIFYDRFVFHKGPM